MPITLKMWGGRPRRLQGDDADLPQLAEEVPVKPTFLDLPIAQPVDCHAGYLDCFARGCGTHELAAVGPLPGPPGRHPVAFGELILHCEPEVRERLPIHVDLFAGAVDAPDVLLVGWIVVVIVLNAIFAFAQEYRADRSADRLRALLPISARVRRDSQLRVIDATQLVQGDLVVLRPGDRISADLNLTVSHALAVDELALASVGTTSGGRR